MNKNIIYIISALLIGLAVGYFAFGGSDPSSESEEAHEHAAEANQMWTCSMHPQIMQPEPGDCPLCGMDLIPAEEGSEGLSPNEIRMTENAMALANIQTSIIGAATTTEGRTITLSGKIMRNEEANTVQASYFEGRIEKLHVNFTGENVRKGQLLATIYAPSLVNTQQELITTASMKHMQPELYQAVRNKLKLWKLSEKQINQIEASGKVQEVFPIYATVSGTVTEKLADEGDYVSQGQPILRLSNLNSVWAMFDAYENQISMIKVGQEIKVSTNAYPEKEYTARISFIDPILNTSSRTIAVRATLNNAGGILKPGMFAVGTLENMGGSGIEELHIPATAVMWTGKRSLVYVKTNPDEPIFEMREVTLGKRSGDAYAVSEGLKSGEEIVTHGTFTVDAAAQLQGKPSMMNQVNGEEAHQQHASLVPDLDLERIKVSTKFISQLSTLFNDYIKLKDALVDDKGSDAQSAAKTFEASLAKLDASELKDKSAKEAWEDYQSTLKSSIAKISSSADIKKQRDEFIALSTAMTNGVQIFGVNKTVYSQYCPMANNDKGAYWLSLEEEIKNPYYGASMLKCGEVKETIK